MKRLISGYSSPSSYKNKVVTLSCHLLTVITRYSSIHDTFITIFRRNPSDTLAAESPRRTGILCTHTKKNVQSTVSTERGNFPTQNAVVYNTAHGPAAFFGELAMKIWKHKSTTSHVRPSVRPSVHIFVLKKTDKRVFIILDTGHLTKSVQTFPLCNQT